MQPFNLTEEWYPHTHRFFPVLFRREVFVLLCVRKKSPWMSRDVLTLLIRALAKAHRDMGMPRSIAWTMPTEALVRPFPNPHPLPLPGLPYPLPLYPLPTAGFHFMNMG
jgi:hypothetical protein